MQKKNKVFFVLSCIFTALSLIGVLFCGLFAVEFLIARANGTSDLGQGIAMALAVVFFLIGACFTGGFSIFGIVFSALGLRLPVCKIRKTSKLFFILDICFILLLPVMYILIFVFNATA